MAEKKILGGITYCGYDRVKKVLVVEGWTLPSPSKVELFINDKRIGEVRLGLSSPYIYSQHPEYEEKNAAWIYGNLLKLEDDAILEARAIYTDGRVQSWSKHCGEPNGKRHGKIEKCILDTDSRKMYIEGWFLPVPDGVEIYAGETKIGEAELGIERERIFSILPEFHDRYCGWRFRENGNVIETGKLSVRLYYGECMQELVCEPQEGDLWEGRDHIELCAYNPRKRILQMKGWILPYPQRIQIWRNGSVIGEPQMNIAKPYLYQRYPEFHEKNAGWQYCGIVDIEHGGYVEIEAIYADGSLKRWSNIEIEVFKEEPILRVNNAMIARNRLIVEGWALPRADKIEIWGKECLGTAQIGIESHSIYQNYVLYGEQCAGWVFGKELDEEIERLRIRMFRGGVCCAEYETEVKKEFCIKAGRVVSAKAVISKKSNAFLAELKIEGWYLPRADVVEIWMDNEKLGEAKTGLSSPGIFELCPAYGEGNASWSFRELVRHTVSDRVQIRVLYQGSLIYTEETAVECEIFEEKPILQVNNVMIARNRLIVEGWALPRADKIEIWGKECLGTAQIGIGSQGVYQNYALYGEQCAGWVFGKELDEEIERLRIRMFRGGVCCAEYETEVKNEFCIKAGRVVSAKAVISKKSNAFMAELKIEGWYLPRADVVEIWMDNEKLGEARTGLSSPGIFELCPAYGEGNASWSFQELVRHTISDKVQIRVLYQGSLIYTEETAVECEIFEEKPILQVNNAMIARNRLIVEGWALPRADKIEIWGKECLGTAQIGIESPSVYQNYALYGEQCAGWAFGKELEEEIKELRIRMFRGDICCAECKAVVENDFQIKEGRVTSGKYNIFTSELKIEGWYLPKADAVEIWMNDKMHGRAEIGISSPSVDDRYSAYGEKNVRWCFEKIEEQINSDRVQIRLIYQDRVVYTEDAVIEVETPKVVSFDIFDTLLVRPVWRPVDLFKIVALRMGYSKSFQKMRMISEQIAREKSMEEDITIQEIYNQMSQLFEIGQEECERLLQCELQVEKDYLRPRKYGKKLFQRALDQEKEIILVSDMYLPKEFLEGVMQENGYRGFHKLYVSGHERISKGSGHLYDKILQEYEEKGITAGEILHVGDNPKADISIPNKKGMQTFYVMCTRTAFQNVPLFDRYAKNLKNEMDNTFLVGFLANLLFDDPFKGYDDGSILNGRLEESGKILFASLLLEYTIWMLREMDKEGISELLLAYRDGYMIERILDELLPYWGKEYHRERLYLSRTVRYNAYVRVPNGFFEALVEYPINGMSIRDFVSKRLLIDEETESKQVIALICGILNKSEEEGIENDSEMAQIVSQISRYYYEHAGQNMEIIDAYCKEKLQGGRKAVFDIGYRGRTVNFLINNYQADIIGYQLFAYSMMDKHEQGCKNTHTFIRYGWGTVNRLGILHHLFEEVLCAQEGTASKIVMQGDEYLIEKEKADYREIIDKIQDEIVEFIRLFMDIVKVDIRLMEFDRYAEFELISDFLQKPCEKDARCIRDMVFEDSEFIKKAGKNAFLNWYNSLFNEEEK